MQASRTSLAYQTNSKGVALVIVLSLLVLITGLVVAFFSSVTTDAVSSTAYSNDAKAKQLADTAVNLVIGQIVEATKGFESAAGVPDTTKPLAWASQPGAIRTFKENGDPDRIFKLYSSRRLVATQAEFISELNPSDVNADVPANWASRTGLYTDLNSPVKDETNADVYPIIDPGAVGVVQGFSITGAPVTGTTNPAPMPSQWLYLLKNGTITSPTPATSSGVTTAWGGGSAEPAPSAANPIVGRIAFWTDDETSKVNINTASEGTYWDTPRGNSPSDNNLAKFQPAQKEFQSYPGHPATTSLSTIFPSLSANQIYDIIPRINGGGSVGGTSIALGAVVPDTDRLYANTDELLLTKDRTSNAGLTKDQLARAKFFLTASSRAPETNLYNQPRISIWPIASGLPAAKTTAFDRLIAFCSTLRFTAGVKPYYFQRSDADSSTTDIGLARNGELYAYLQRLTGKAVPGFGGNFLDKYKVSGVDIGERDQILTEIFDYIRSTNLNDDLLGTTTNQFTDPRSTVDGPVAGSGQVTPTIKGNTKGFGRFFTLSEFGIHFICTADPANAASNDPTTNKTLEPATPLALNQKRVQAMIELEYFSPSQGYAPLGNDFQIEIEGLSALSLGGTNLGLPGSTDNWTTIKGYPVNIINGRGWGGSMGPRIPLAATRNIGKRAPARGPIPADPLSSPTLAADKNTFYPFVSVPVTVNTTSGTMSFTGGPVSVKIYSGTGPRSLATLIQTINIAVPGGTFPIPNLPADNKLWAFHFNGYGGANPSYGRLRLVEGFAFGTTNLYSIGDDIVRTMYPSHGDYRLVAAQAIVPDTLFVKHRLWDSTSRFASSFTDSQSTSSSLNPGYDDGGKYIPTVTYGAGVEPDIPANATQTPASTGDWDLGVANIFDGPYINKPDEGNTFRGPTGTSFPYYDNNENQVAAGPTFFSPNRIIPSSGMFGSLPTGVKAGIPWKTLLFRPQTLHPSHSTNIPDHLLMDLFWMPVVEPYAISEPFSTAGKVNMNYQIVPFTSIERSTAMRAVLKSEKVGAILTTAGMTYKTNDGSLNVFRREIDVNAASNLNKKDTEIPTLSQFASKFASGGIFRSATEICDLHIVPTGETLARMSDTTVQSGFWSENALSGDNLRERIYTTMYPRLTTKSNSYIVHYRVQVLKKAHASTPAVWTESKDQVLSEYRGSSTIERYIDPNDSRLPDFAIETDPIRTNIDQYYRFRVVQTKRFAP